MFASDDTVTLRRLGIADLQAFQRYRQDPVVGRFQRWTAMDDTKAKAFLESMAQTPVPAIGGWCQIGIARADNGVLIGDFGLNVAQDHSAAELGITLSRDAQGHSLGFRAVHLVTEWVFQTTSVPKIVAITDERNSGAQALLARLGWPQVDTLGPDVEIEGLTEFVYECTRPEP